MAAMAPALTDAPAEAHHIRFKLAAPSSSLSPGSTENNGNARNIILHGSGINKCKAISEDRSLEFCGSNSKNQEQPLQQPQQPVSAPQASTLSKIQPLVASYLCSDVTPVASTKESIKLQGVLIKQSVLKSHAILPSSLFNGGDFLFRKKQTIELSGSQLKSLMNSSPSSSGQPMVPVNGLAKKLNTIPGSGFVVAVNGGKPSATTTDLNPQTTTLDSKTLGETLPGQLKTKRTNNYFSGVSQSGGGNDLQQPTAYLTASTPSACGTAQSEKQLKSEVPHLDTAAYQLHTADVDRAEKSQQCSLASQPNHTTSSSSQSSLDSQVRERSLLNSSRHDEIEGRLRCLRRRLQVVQAKQVERHLHQQLDGFLDSALSRLPINNCKLETTAFTATWRSGRHSSNTRDSLGRFLKSSSIPSELERLYLSGTANLHSVESAFDSDVTESSSGGDSDIEEEELSRVDIDQPHVKIWKRAESRYTVERAAIISHWNWLQAHISDLEYRIRQQTDIYRQIRMSKGSVELGGLAPSGLVSGIELKTESISSQDGGSEHLDQTATTRVPSTEAGPWRCQNGRLVNGVRNRVMDNNYNKNQQSTSYEGSCAAARTRPLLSCRRRRLIQPHAVPSLIVKAQRSSVHCSCRVNSFCVMCGGRPTPKEEPQYQLPTLERLSKMDPGIHPILSFPDDVCVGLRLQQVLKSQRQNKTLDRSKALKKLFLKHKLSKDKHKLSNSLTSLKLGHCKNRAEKRQLLSSGGNSSGSKLEGQLLCMTERLQALSSPLGPYDKSYSRKKLRQHSLDRTDPSPKVYLESGSSCSSLASLHSSIHSPITRQLSTSSESSTPLILNSQSVPNTPQPIKRRRGESSFDINNIVIPMSVAATTRVEKLQYKEILTPSWRECDVLSQPETEEESDVAIEDLSEAAFTQLHQPCEDQERSRWTWMALAPAQRRGSRSYKSMDGRTTPLPCGANPSTSQPASPDPVHCPLLHEYSYIPSPVSPASPDATSNPYTPCSRDSHRLLSSEDTRCSTPDFPFEERTVAPWERRNFPLSEDPAPEPEVETDIQPIMRSLSGCRAPGYGRLDPDETDLPCEDDGQKHKAVSYR
ncbi:KAT8 regulatory NSL complex subunit 1-like [Aplochiton taeniatus]